MNELAASPTDRSVARTTARRRFRWGLALLFAALLIAAWLGWRWVGHGMPLPLEIVIDGERLPLLHGQIASLPWTGQAAPAVGIAVAAIALPIALGIALLAVLAALLLVLLLAVALPLLLGAAVLLIVLSPLWILAWLLWRMARASRRSATMAA